MSTIDGGGVAVEEAPVPGPGPEAPRSRKKMLIILGIVAALVALVAAVFIWYLITHKSLSQLPGINKLYAPPAYKGSIYGATQPIGVAVSPDGQKVYVTQSGGKRTTLLFDRSGKLRATLAPPSTTGTSHVPVYVAVSPKSGDVYVSDRLTGQIYVYEAHGTYKKTFKSADVKPGWQPLALAFDPKGNFYVSDVSGKVHKVLVFDPTGRLTRTLTTPDTAMSFPNSIAIDDAGHVLVTDSNNGRMLAFDANGKVFATVNRGIGEGDLGLPRGLVVDSEGRVSVVDATNMQINVYRLGDESSNTVTFLGSFGAEGIANGQFEYPNGIATDSRSELFVTDRENGRVQVWSY